LAWKDTVIWITGASSGIGEALTNAFYRDGARLIISSRRPEVLEEVKKSLGADSGQIYILPLDLTQTDQHDEKVQEALQAFGHIDMLVNNGGISQRSGAVETKLSVVRQLMEVNFFGTISLTKALLPAMIERQSGHIVVISSVMGKFSTHSRSTYAASKHALHGWFEALRQEVMDDNIAISMVCPGFVRTNVAKNSLTADGSKHNKMGDGHAKAMTADEFARKLLPKLAAKKAEVFITGIKERLALYLSRFAPGLLRKILKNSKVT